MRISEATNANIRLKAQGAKYRLTAQGAGYRLKVMGISRPQPPLREAGFALIEMLVAMLLLSLVGLTLARFQTFQLAGTASVAAAAAARLEADNRVIDVLAAPEAPSAPESGVSDNFGRQWHWTVEPGPAPDRAMMPELVLVKVTVGTASGGPALVSRSVLRPRSYGADPSDPSAGRRP